MAVTAVSKLQQSQLVSLPQMEMLGGDVNLANFHTEMRDQAGLDLSECISSATVTRTMDGASNIAVVVEDDASRTIQRSGRLGRGVDVNIDGLWWTLVGVGKKSRQLTLTWEEREVNVLRYYNSLMYADRSKVTRAEFVLRMIKEVKEIALKYQIPELSIVQPISDVGPNQVLVDATGKPVISSPTATDPTQAAVSRAQGIISDPTITVKGVEATPEQLNNAQVVLTQANAMRANYTVKIAAITTAITESRIINLYGGDLDSVGVFQQRRSQGWPATRDVATDAAAFLQSAIKINAANPQLPVQQLCQAVQHSAFADGSNYARWVDEAVKIVASYGDMAPGSMSNNMGVINSVGGANFFMRGQLTKRGQTSAYVLTKESSWACMQRLANEVNWRAFCVSGTIYFISDQYLFKSKPFMSVSEDDDGIDWIDYDYDEGKKKATVTITAHLSRWSAPPGGIVRIHDQGIIDGNWIVNSVVRSLYETTATITLQKPQPILPEPTQLSSVAKGFTGKGVRPGARIGLGLSVTQGNAIQQKVVAYVQSQLGVPYAWGAEAPGVDFDCSGLAQAAYDSAGIKIPRIAQTQYDAGTIISPIELQPGDLVFFGPDTSHIEHVGIYIGNGAMIDAPHTGAVVRVDQGFSAWTDPAFAGATRPWL